VTSAQLPSQCRNIERVTSLRILDRHRCQQWSSHCHRTCEQPGIILLQSVVCSASPTKPRQTSYSATRRVPCNRRCQCDIRCLVRHVYGGRPCQPEYVHQPMQANRLLRQRTPVYHWICEADDILFNRALKNMCHHVLQTYLPDRSETTWAYNNLRNRTHNKSPSNKRSHLNKKKTSLYVCFIKTPVS